MHLLWLVRKDIEKRSAAAGKFKFKDYIQLLAIYRTRARRTIGKRTNFRTRRRGEARRGFYPIHYLFIVELVNKRRKTTHTYIETDRTIFIYIDRDARYKRLCYSINFSLHF